MWDGIHYEEAPSNELSLARAIWCLRTRSIPRLLVSSKFMQTLFFSSEFGQPTLPLSPDVIFKDAPSQRREWCVTDLDLPTSSPFNDVKESRRRQMESESKASNAMLWGGGVWWERDWALGSRRGRRMRQKLRHFNLTDWHSQDEVRIRKSTN